MWFYLIGVDCISLSLFLESYLNLVNLNRYPNVVAWWNQQSKTLTRILPRFAQMTLSQRSWGTNSTRKRIVSTTVLEQWTPVLIWYFESDMKVRSRTYYVHICLHLTYDDTFVQSMIPQKLCNTRTRVITVTTCLRMILIPALVDYTEHRVSKMCYHIFLSNCSPILDAKNTTVAKPYALCTVRLLWPHSG